MNAMQMIRNVLTSRRAWLSKLLDPSRDIDAECGHPDLITIDDYEKMWKRGDVSSRVVSILPEETWSENPDIFETEDESETEFEKAWKLLLKSVPVFTYLQRADVLSGIGRFGVILLGLDDGKPMNEAVEGIGPDGKGAGGVERKLLYMRPLSERIVTVGALESDVTSPRYGQPIKYEVCFSEDVTDGPQPSSMVPGNVTVHWSRVLHLADNRANSEVFGRPRMEVVYNRLLDLRKIAGGSGEMFWKGGFPGISLETQPGGDEDVEFDKTATAEELDKYMNGLQRYIATVGMTAKSMSVQVADPLPHLDLQLRLIATALGVPMRVLVGSERGELASSQDAVAWNNRLGRRRTEYLNPFVLVPLVERLIALGVLPAPAEEGFQIEWPDLNTPSELEEASVSEKITAALAKYVQGGVDQLMPPFHYLTLVLGFDKDEADAVIKAAEKQLGDDDFLLEDRNPPPPPGSVIGPNGKPVASQPGVPPNGASAKPRLTATGKPVTAPRPIGARQ